MGTAHEGTRQYHDAVKQGGRGMQIDREAPQRTRLLLAMASAVAAKGYAAVTIADVVAGAGVSKRTFYEHFTGKEDCLFACYSDSSDALAAVVREAAAHTGSGPQRVVAAIQAYFRALDASGPVVAAMLTEIQATGAAGRDLRRAKTHEFAALIRELVADDAAAGTCAPLDEPVSLALVGGLYELGLSHAETSPEVPFSSLAPAAERYILAILRPDVAPVAARPGRRKAGGASSPVPLQHS
jgi:AcrR family transcriptional regulator